MHPRYLYQLLLLCGSIATAAASAQARSARVLRVCADPANLPYSNSKLKGFENRIATLVANELHARLAYTWWSQRRGFLRQTLQAGVCDVVVGVPLGVPGIRSSRPYYRSTFAFVSRKDHQLGDLRSIDDPRLGRLKIGVSLAGDDGSNPAPVHALNRRGRSGGLVGFPLADEYERAVPAAVAAVIDGSIDVAILWGPVAGAGALTSAVPLRVEPLSEERDGDLPFAFSIGMAVRPDDEALARELDHVIRRRGRELTGILRSAGVPLVARSSDEPEASSAR
ncbi:MAG TPA: quinoprotein dehydrogenase-associated putative ABC transporter substrate-binding protein [Polyangiaceae bacterium]|nr:quinoprotein dehydrogenase-associated putative ABC transporter substrate-binding protein [Polyangiaceae bacterium]